MCNQITFKFLGNISFMHLTNFHKSEKWKNKKLKFANENYLLFRSYYFSKQPICILYTYSLNMQTTKISSTYDNKWNLHFARNCSKYLLCLTVSLSTQILVLNIAPLLFISVSILCGFAMLRDVCILLSPQKEEQMYTFGSTFIKKIKSSVCHYISMPW